MRSDRPFQYSFSHHVAKDASVNNENHTNHQFDCNASLSSVASTANTALFNALIHIRVQNMQSVHCVVTTHISILCLRLGLLMMPNIFNDPVSFADEMYQ